MNKNKQSELFNKIHNRYKDHYFDDYSNFYRRKIVLKKISKYFKNKARILEVGCGSGSNYQIFNCENMISGFYYAIDISNKAVEDLIINKKQECFCI